jgi:hypothetical protein
MMLGIYADIVRAVVIALGAITTGAVGVVLRLHWRAWQASASRGGGLLPGHVWMVALAHTVYVIGTSLGMVDQLGQVGVTWRVWLYVVGSLLTLVALLQVARYQYRRVYEQTATTVVTTQLTVADDEHDRPR